MKRTFTRFVALLLCVMMFASVMGLSAIAEGAATENLYQEKLKITIEVPDMPDVVGTGDRVTQYLMDKFNVEFEFIAPTYGEQMEKLRMIMASGKYPDVIQTWGKGNSDHETWVKDGLILDITEYLDRYPHVKAVTDTEEYQIWKTDDGKWYGIPKYYAAWYPWGFQIRTDWLKELGLEMPRTTDELYEVLKAFVAADPDGQKNIGLTANFDFFLYEFLIPAFTGINGWGLYDGEYVQSQTHPGYKEYLKYMNKLYTEGLLDPDFALNKDGIGVEKFLAGRAGVLSYNIDAAIFNKTYDTLLQNFPDASMDIIAPPIEGPMGFNQPGGALNANSLICFTVDTPPAKVERMLAILDYLFSEEGIMLGRYGIEGIHYTMDGDKITINEAEKLADKAKTGDIVWDTGVHVLYIIAAYEFTRFTPESTPRHEILAPAFELSREAKILTNPTTGILTDSQVDYGAQVGDVIATYAIKFITGKLDIEAGWQEYLDALDAAGYKQIKTDINALLMP